MTKKPSNILVNLLAAGGQVLRTNGRGISSCQAEVASAGLNSIRLRHAGIVRSSYNAADQKRKGSFTEMNMLITTGLTGLTFKKRSSSIKATGNCGTLLWNDKTAMGVLLYPDKEGDCKSKFRCWVYVYCI